MARKRPARRTTTARKKRPSPALAKLAVALRERQEAVEQQAATSDILKAIARSPTDLAPVFDAILLNATRLCQAHMGILGLYDGKHYRTGSQIGANAGYAKWLAERGPFEVAPDSALGRDRMRKAEGTGLGLALTRRFVELHGGAIRLDSAPGQGSTFSFTLPLRP